MHTTEDEHLLDLAHAQRLESVREHGDATEREEDTWLVERKNLEAAVVRVGQNDGLEGRLVDIVAALESAHSRERVLARVSSKNSR